MSSSLEGMRLPRTTKGAFENVGGGAERGHHRVPGHEALGSPSACPGSVPSCGRGTARGCAPHARPRGLTCLQRAPTRAHLARSHKLQDFSCSNTPSPLHLDSLPARRLPHSQNTMGSGTSHLGREPGRRCYAPAAIPSWAPRAPTRLRGCFTSTASSCPVDPAAPALPCCLDPSPRPQAAAPLPPSLFSHQLLRTGPFL